MVCNKCLFNDKKCESKECWRRKNYGAHMAQAEYRKGEDIKCPRCEEAQGGPCLHRIDRATLHSCHHCGLRFVALKLEDPPF